VVAVTACAVTMIGAHAANASPSASELKKQINAATDQLEKLGEQYNAANISLKKTQGDLKTLQASIGPAKAALNQASAQVTTIAATAYQQGRAGPMTALLDGNSGDLMAKMGFLDQIQQSNRRDIDNFTLTTQTFAQRQTQLKSLQSKQVAQVAEINAQKKTAQQKLDKLKQLRISAGEGAQDSAGPSQKAPKLSGSAGKAVDFAYAQQGKSYLLGAAGPSKWDCSGLTMKSWASAGYSLPHNAAAQWGVVAHISRSSLKAGDLVFYNSLSHVGIYVGNNQIIDAPRPGELVAVRSINRGMPIYGYGRVT
jgi:cell wall-associated NlpC family hydrolase